MAVKLQRPILVGGVALSFGLWMFDSVWDSFANVGEYTLWGAIALGAGLWFLRRKKPVELALSPVELPSDRKAVEAAVAKAERAIDYLENEASDRTVTTPLRERLTQIAAEMDRQNVRLTLIGNKSAGKTALKQGLESGWLPQQQRHLSLQEIPTLSPGTDSETAEKAAIETVTLTSDLVLFIIAGDLTDTEFQILRQLTAANQRVLLVFNKQDQYSPTDRAVVLQQLRQRTQAILNPEDVIAIAASPAPIKVRQHQADNSVREWMEEQKPDLTALTAQLDRVLAKAAQPLIWANAIRQAGAIEGEVKQELNRLRRNRALPVIEKSQWIAGATAFANPVPALDLLATAAISAQLVKDLGEIYQQKFSLQQAQAAAKAMGELMLKLGLVELSSQAVGSILKGHAFTYVAGGAVQGVSAAYLTRLAGLSLIEYYQEQELSQAPTSEQPFNLDRLGQKLQQVFQQNQRTAFLQGFAKSAIARLSPTSPQTELTSAKATATSS
jgi:hypothetical protein